MKLPLLGTQGPRPHHEKQPHTKVCEQGCLYIGSDYPQVSGLLKKKCMLFCLLDQPIPNHEKQPKTKNSQIYVENGLTLLSIEYIWFSHWLSASSLADMGL